MKKNYFLLSFCFFAFQARATTYYVKTGGNNSSAGTSWSTAKADLQNAINASSAGDEIWIAAGTYKPTLDPSTGTASGTTRDYSFYLDKNIEIYGGFAGTETALSQRSSTSNPVILSGDIGTVGSSSDNCYHVFISEGLTSAAILDGVTITGGNADGSGALSYSGATNFHRRIGGGLYVNKGNPVISGCLIIDNSAEWGGGLYIHGGGSNNPSTAPNYSSATIENCAIVGNIATTQGGGGVYCNWNGNANFYNCVFYENSAVDGGAVRNTSHTHPDFFNCAFIKNTASSAGGGIQSWSTCNIKVYNSVFYGNTSGGTNRNDIHSTNNSSTTITHSSMGESSSTYNSTNSSSISGSSNNKFAQNPLFFNYSDPDGADNIWMTRDDGLRVKANSPTFDCGLNSHISGYSTDIAGANRIINSTVNMGPYELKSCESLNSLPSSAATYTATYADTYGSYTCYCDDDNKFILGLDTTSTGAVVPTTGVSLEIGASTTTSWTNSGGIITNSSGGSIINRKWNVVPTTQPTSDVTVIYPFTNTEASAIISVLNNAAYADANDLQLYKLTSSGTFADPHASGATGVILTHGASASTSNWVWSQHSNGTDHLATYKVSSFSGGGGGGGASGNPLPVELIHFDAQAAANHTADLHWQTASELNNNYFDVERSYDAIHWEWVGNVTGNGTTNQLTDYSFTDKSIATSQNMAYYRLNQIDYDGANEYTDIRSVRFTVKPNAFEIAAYPNPFNQEVTIRIRTTELYSIEVTDINGLVMLNIENEDKGMHRLDLSTWASGVYVINVTSTQGTKHLKVMKQ
jgi:hypothetical protein